MDDKMQTKQLAQGQFRSFSLAHPKEIENTPKLGLLQVSVPKPKLKFGRPLYEHRQSALSQQSYTRHRLALL